MKLAWLTDIHLNFLKSADRLAFYQDVADNDADAVVISGDITEAPVLGDHLTEMADNIKKPIYFVLGNHDYYRGSVCDERNSTAELTQKHPLLHWLPASGIIELEPGTLLVGEDCWADGRYGDYTNSFVVLNDSRMIQELYEAYLLGKSKLLNAMQKLADGDAKQLKIRLEQAIQQHQPKKIVVLIHVPPFRESCMHEGQISNDDFLPFFSSKITGDVLFEVAVKNQDVEFLVLCGHTHSESFYQPCDNLTIKAGSAEYRDPKIQEIVEV